MVVPLVALSHGAEAPMLPGRHYLAGSLGLGLLLGLFHFTAPPPAETPPLPPLSPPNLGGDKGGGSRPTLAVLVIFDQLRGDYLTRWDTLFGAGGFHRLEREGAWFQNCHYPYSDTVTGAGHASVATGCSPDVHGVVGNEWFDRQTGTSVYCVSSATPERCQRVPPLPRIDDGRSREPSGTTAKKKPQGVSPERLLAPTLADALKSATGGQGRVVSLSFKDRSAVLPGGRHPDACYWLDTLSGEFVTSTCYRDRLHPWVAQYNRSGAADRWRGQSWTRLRDFDYEPWSGPDDQAGEGRGVPPFTFQGRVFPHPMEGLLPIKPPYYAALFNSPFGNDLLLGLAERAIDAEKLGTHPAPDLLCISFSSNDAAGHCWGPDSQEVLDVTLRSDRIVKRLLDRLDARVGKGRYVLALTADHGVCPLPEVARRHGADAGRIDPGPLLKKAEAFLHKKFPVPAGEEKWVRKNEGSWLYLNGELLLRHGLRQDKVEAALAGWLSKQPGIQTACTRSQLLAGIPAEDMLGQMVKRSFYPERSGEVRLIEKPHYLLTSYLTGTNHGTPHSYDTHVPLLVYGPGVRPGVRQEAITPQTAAVILAQALGIKPPAQATARVPAGLLESP